MPIISFASLTNFLKASRGESQEQILEHFVRLIILPSGLVPCGALTIYDPEANKLIVHNLPIPQGDDNKPCKWASALEEVNETEFGLRGVAFSTADTQNSTRFPTKLRFCKGPNKYPCGEVVCIPIPSRHGRKPFGVVSFHAGCSDQENVFDAELLEAMETAVQALGTALDASPVKLERARKSRVFIVHGRDLFARRTLQLILTERGIQPVVLQEQPWTGTEILRMLMEALSECSGAFVLLSPDDEGRQCEVVDGLETELMQRRVRQNVLFEAGMVFATFGDARRLCFLCTAPLEVPSDLRGLLVEAFDSHQPDVERLERILTAWGLKWQPPSHR